MTQDLRITKGNETKDRILNASMIIISKEGIEGLSAKKIADQAKISKSNLFHHFGSVNELMNVLFESILTDLVEPVKSYSGSDLSGFLLFLGESVYFLNEEEQIIYSVLLHFYIRCLHNEEYKNLLLKMKEEMIAAIATQLNRYSTKSIEDLLQISEMIVMTLDGYGIHSVMESDLDSFQKMWELQVKTWQPLIQ